MVIGSRDHAKTTFFSELYPIEKSISDPGETCIISFSEDQVKEIIGKTKEFVETKPLLNDLKPKNPDDWSKTELRLANGSRISGLSFGSSIRGRHPKRIIIDDPVKDFGGMNDQDQFRFYTNVIVPMCTPHTQLIITASRVKDGDLIDQLESKKIFEPYLYPAIRQGKALWPQRWSLESLEQRRKEIGDHAFNREYLLLKVNPETSFFKQDQIHYYDDSNVMPARLYRIMSVDPAITAGGDFTGMVVTGTDQENKTYVLDFRNIKTDNIQNILDEIMSLAQLYRIDQLQMEAIGFQRLLRHWLDEEMRKRNFYFGVEEIRHHSKSKQARIMALQPRIQSGSLLFKPGQTELIQQLLSFPNGKFDDIIDSLSMQINRWNTPGEIPQEIPEGSFDWWVNQTTHADDWRTSLFEDVAK